MENISLQEEDFVRKVCLDLDNYVSKACVNKVFVFPPLNNRLRFIIHRTVQEEYQHAKLTTFSIGHEEKRRTVICYLDNLKRPVFKKINHRMPEDARVQNETKCKDHLQAGTMSTSQCRSRRPDMQLYVPRAQRNRVPQNLAEVPHEEFGESGNRCGGNEKTAPKKDTVKKTKIKLKQEIHRPASVKSKKTAQKSADLQLDSNADVPLENYNTDNCGGIPEPALDATILCNDDGEQNNDFEDEVVNVGSAMFDENVQSEVESKQVESETKHMETEQNEIGFVVQINSAEIAGGNVSDCDISTLEERVSECKYESETGRANSVYKEGADFKEGNEVAIFDSGSVTASDHVKAETESCVKALTDSNIHDLGSWGNCKRDTKNTLEVLNAEAKSDDDKSWDSLYDDSGDCLDPDLMEELTEAVCTVNIQKPQIDYFAFKVKDPEISDEDFGHIVEIYGFPTEFKTEDLMSALSPFKNSGYNIKWVDDTHALGVFPSQMVASDVLATDHPLIKTRPLSQAIKASKMKAKHCAEFLLPYKQRPETSATLARRLVTGALGITTNVSRQQREIERRKLQEARARKKLAIKQREAAWEGTLGDCTSETSTSNKN